LLKQIPAAGLKGVKVAAFDTRIPMTDKVPPILRFLVKFFGYAARPIADRLKKSGGNLALPPNALSRSLQGPGYFALVYAN
jgi:hypothetical protein